MGTTYLLAHMESTMSSKRSRYLLPNKNGTVIYGSENMLVIESGKLRAQAGIITMMMLLLGPTVTEFGT